MLSIGMCGVYWVIRSCCSRGTTELKNAIEAQELLVATHQEENKHLHQHVARLKVKVEAAQPTLQAHDKCAVLTR